MSSSSRLAPASALLVMMLTACATSSGLETPAPVQLPPVPADLKICFDRMVPQPPAGDLTRAQVFRLLGEMRQLDEAKSGCGRRLVAWFEMLALGFDKGTKR